MPEAHATNSQRRRPLNTRAMHARFIASHWLTCVVHTLDSRWKRIATKG